MNVDMRADNLIEPVYLQSQPNQPIALGSHRARVISGGITLECPVDVVMRFLPDSSLEFRVAGVRAELSDVFDDCDNDSVRLLDRDISVPVITTSAGNGITMVPNRQPVVATMKSAALRKGLAGLFNFPAFYGQMDYGIEVGNSAMRCGRLELEADGWRMTVAAMRDTRDRHRALKETGGYYQTHMVEVVRTDGASFSSDEFSERLDLLGQFLAFGIGRRPGLGFACGYDGSNECVWERWGLGQAHRDAWSPSDSWFNDLRGEMLQVVFSGFARLWNEPVWNEPLRHSVYWYVGANVAQTGIGVDSRLILAQAALETLAWTVCVQWNRMVSASAFERRGLSAADKLRLLLSSCRIPKEIPDAMKALRSKQGDAWKDGPEAVTVLRNRLVHPEKNPSKPADGSYYEACTLALWYIELALLSLAGYDGDYANRTTFAVQSVPWAESDTEG